jgi:hypothetical protein
MTRYMLTQSLLRSQGPEVHRGYSQPGLEKVSQYMGGKEDDEEVGERMREVQDCKERFVNV